MQWMLGRAAFFALGLLIGSGTALAQVPERVTEMRGPIEATPLDWKWKKLRDGNVFWRYVRNKGGPLVVSLPAAPGERANGIGDHMARLFYEQGYSLGVLTWRDDRARRQSVSESVAEVASQFAHVQADAERFGEFDPNRVIVLGIDDDAFPAALLAFGGAQSAVGADASPICAAVFINGMNFDASSPDTLIAKRRFAEDPAALRFSPNRHAAKAPPTLLMTEITDSVAATRSDALAAAIRAAGGIAVRATLPEV